MPKNRPGLKKNRPAHGLVSPENTLLGKTQIHEFHYEHFLQDALSRAAVYIMSGYM